MCSVLFVLDSRSVCGKSALSFLGWGVGVEVCVAYYIDLGGVVQKGVVSSGFRGSVLACSVLPVICWVIVWSL